MTYCQILITKEMRDLLTEQNKVDAMVHRHFSATFQGKVERFGAERMRLAVEELRRINEQVRSYRQTPAQRTA